MPLGAMFQALLACLVQLFAIPYQPGNFFFFLFFGDSFVFISSPWLMLDSIGLRYSALLILLKITVLIFLNFPSVGQTSSSS